MLLCSMVLEMIDLLGRTEVLGMRIVVSGVLKDSRLTTLVYREICKEKTPFPLAVPLVVEIHFEAESWRSGEEYVECEM